MNRSRILRAAAALLLTAIAAGAAGWFLGTRDAQPAAPASGATTGPVTVVDGVTVVEVAPAVQRRSGIATAPAAAAGEDAARSLVPVPGVVLDLQPLIEWRNRLVAAGTQAQAAQAQWQASQRELERTQRLYADDQNASRRALEAAQSAGTRDRAQSEAARAALRAVTEQGRQLFGAVLADWGAGEGGALDALLARREAIVAVAIDLPGDAPPREIRVEAAGIQGGTRAAWISAAAQADPQLGRGLQLYRVPVPLPAHARVVARIDRSQRAAGVLVPLAAAVWQGGQPWAYVRRDASHFARIALPGAIETRDGLIVPGTIQPGQQLVTQGAQLLLSQEQLPPGGRACKDPECD